MGRVMTQDDLTPEERCRMAAQKIREDLGHWRFDGPALLHILDPHNETRKP